MTAAARPEASRPAIRVVDEIRIALAMSGGIALTVYEAGVAHEVSRAARAMEGEGAYNALLAKVDRLLSVDIITGASAGGITAIALASALATHGDFGALHNLWLEDADLAKLEHQGPPQNSLLDTSLVRSVLHNRLESNKAACEPGQGVRDLLVVITRTNLAGRRRILTDALGHKAVVATKEDPRTFFAEDFCDETQIPVLVNAALATSAFPVVFPPVEMDGTYYADGGLLDNQPVGHAIKAIRDKKAAYRTRRYVVFVEPNPESFKTSRPRRPSVAEVALQIPLMGTKGNIWRAVAEMDDFNRRRDHYEHLEKLLVLHVAQPMPSGPAGTKAAVAGPPASGGSAPAPMRLGIPGGVRFEELFLGQDPLVYTHWRSVAALAFQDAEQEEQWMKQVVDAAANMDFCIRWLRGLIGLINRVIEQTNTLTMLQMTLIEVARDPDGEPSDKVALYTLLDRLRQALYPRRGPDADASPFNLERQLQKWQALLVPDGDVDPMWDAEAMRIEFERFPARVAGWIGDSSLPRAGEVPTRVVQDIVRVVGRRAIEHDEFWQVCLRVCQPEVTEIPERRRGEEAAVGQAFFDAFRRADIKTYALDALTDLHHKENIKFVRISPNDTDNLHLIGADQPEAPLTLARVKLAGELLGHMGGFLDERWRRNDYIWGRLDAAEVLINLVVATDGRQSLLTPQELKTYIKQAQKEILDDEHARHAQGGGGRRPPLPQPSVDNPSANKKWIGYGRETLLSLPPEQLRRAFSYLMTTSLALGRGNPSLPNWALDWMSRILRALAVLLRPATMLVRVGGPLGNVSPPLITFLLGLLIFGGGFLLGRYTMQEILGGITTVLLIGAAALFVFLLGAVAGWRWWIIVPVTSALSIAVTLWQGPAIRARMISWQPSVQPEAVVKAVIVLLMLISALLLLSVAWPSLRAGVARMRSWVASS